MLENHFHSGNWGESSSKKKGFVFSYSSWFIDRLVNRACRLHQYPRRRAVLTFDVDVGSGAVIQAIFGVITAVGARVIGTQMWDRQLAAVRVRMMFGGTPLHLHPFE